MTSRRLALCITTMVVYTVVLTVCATPLVQRAGAQRPDTVVKQAGRAVHPGGGTMVPELSIGVVDGPQEYMLGNVRDVLELRNGSILVVDAQTPAIRQYDAKGVYVRTLGRKGQGPGEYTRPGMLGELRDGRIVLVDGGNVRVNVYSRDGESVDTWRLTGAGGGTVASSRITVDTTGTLVLPIYAYGGGTTEGQRLLRLSPSGQIIDTIHAPVFAYTAPTADAVGPGGRGSATSAIPFFPVTRWVWSPLGYMVTGVANRYAFELRLPGARKRATNATIPAMGYRGPSAPWAAGDPVVSIRHGAPPVTVSDEQRSVERTRVENFLRTIDPGWKYNGPDVPRIKPPYKDLRLGEDGTIWIQLSMPGERFMPEPPSAGSPNTGPVLPEWREPGVFDVFQPDGRYLGRVERPRNVTMWRMTADRVWGVMRDDDDVETVKRFRIDWR